MKLNSRDLALIAVFAALYAALVYTLPGISFQLVQVRIADALIPLSIVFGWPVVIGVTVGAAVSNVITPLPSIIVDITFGAIANFIASFVAWKIGGLKYSITVNWLVIVGAIFAFVSLVSPWWYFNLTLLGEPVLNFTVYAGWFGGELGTWINAIHLVAEWIGLELFNEVVNGLKLTLYLVGLGTFIALIGACIRGNRGRVIIALGVIPSIFGVINFYVRWSQLLASIAMPVTGFRSIEWIGTTMAEASWNWAWGIYMASFACFFVALAIVLHSHMPQIEINEIFGCLVATIAITFIVGTYLAVITGMDIWTWWLGVGIGSVISINILGYMLIQIMKKLK